MPEDLQERVVDRCAVIWDMAKESDAATILAKIREKVKNIAKSRSDISTPKPMEVDRVWAEDGHARETHQHDGDVHDLPEDACGVCAVGKGKRKSKITSACFICSEIGHRAAECPNKAKAREVRRDGTKGPALDRLHGHTSGAGVRPTCSGIA